MNIPNFIQNAFAPGAYARVQAARVLSSDADAGSRCLKSLITSIDNASYVPGEASGLAIKELKRWDEKLRAGSSPEIAGGTLTSVSVIKRRLIGMRNNALYSSAGARPGSDYLKRLEEYEKVIAALRNFKHDIVATSSRV